MIQMKKATSSRSGHPLLTHPILSHCPTQHQYDTIPPHIITDFFTHKNTQTLHTYNRSHTNFHTFVTQNTYLFSYLFSLSLFFLVQITRFPLTQIHPHPHSNPHEKFQSPCDDLHIKIIIRKCPHASKDIGPRFTPKPYTEISLHRAIELAAFYIYLTMGSPFIFIQFSRRRVWEK